MAPANEPPDLNGVTPGELGRLVRDVLVRFEGLAARLETQFVRTDNFDLYKQLVDNAIKQLQTAVSTAADKAVVNDRLRDLDVELDKRSSKSQVDDLAKRVGELEDDKKWLVRVVVLFVITMVLTGAVAVSKLTGGP